MKTKRIEIKNNKITPLEVTAISQIGKTTWRLKTNLIQSFFDQYGGYTLCSLFNFYSLEIQRNKKLF